MLKFGRYWPWKTVWSHFHMPVRPMSLHRPPFRFDCFVKIWATCKNFLGKWFTAPLAKNSPYAYDFPVQYKSLQITKMNFEKTVRLTSFQNILAIFFRFIHPCFLLYLLTFIPSSFWAATLMFHSSCVVIMMSVAALVLTESSVESSLSAMHMDEHT